MPPDFWGKTFGFEATLTVNTADWNVRTWLAGQGWNGTDRVILTIAAGVYVYATTTSGYAMTVSGSFPNGIEITNYGYILGKGGAGGAGGKTTYSGSGTGQTFAPTVTSSNAGLAGNSGGPALLISTNVTFTNASGAIIGGGGGGGGGGALITTEINSSTAPRLNFGGGGGGGGAGGYPSGGAAGVSGTRDNYNWALVGSTNTWYVNVLTSYLANSPTSPSAGTPLIGGGYGGGVYGVYWANSLATVSPYPELSLGLSAGSGGAGGDLGQAGQAGNVIAPDTVPTTSGPYNNTADISTSVAGSGGAAGNAIVGTSYITWVSQGDIRGPTVA
jgi:hypothetical protein